VKELKKVLHYINENNPYGEEFSWAEFFDMIFDEIKIKVGSTNIKRLLNPWIDNNLKQKHLRKRKCFCFFEVELDIHGLTYPFFGSWGTA